MKRSWIMAMAAGLALAGCGGGSGSNNDQGIAVRFIGVFQETQEQVAPAADRLPDDENAVGDTGRVISLDTSLAVPNDTNFDGDEAAPARLQLTGRNLLVLGGFIAASIAAMYYLLPQLAGLEVLVQL